MLSAPQSSLPQSAAQGLTPQGIPTQHSPLETPQQPTVVPLWAVAIVESVQNE